jgi:hypothetical protein
MIKWKIYRNNIYSTVQVVYSPNASVSFASGDASKWALSIALKMSKGRNGGAEAGKDCVTDTDQLSCSPEFRD